MPRRERKRRVLPPISPAPADTGRLLRYAPVLIVLAAVVPYFPAFTGGFVWDDEALITSNPLVRAEGKALFRALGGIWFGGHGVDFFPLTTTLHWLQYRFFGNTPAGYHAVNVFLHAITALLFWRVLRALAFPGALFAALIFAVHPVHVASVAWLSELKNTLSVPLVLGSFLAWLGYEERRNTGAFVTAVLLFAASLLAKTSGVMFPVFLLLFIWWRHHGLPNAAGEAADGETKLLRIINMLLATIGLIVAIAAGFLLSSRTTSAPGRSATETAMFIFAVVVWLSSAFLGFAAAVFGRSLRPALVRLVPFFQLSALLGAATIWFQHGAIGELIEMGGIARRLASAGDAVWFYLGKLLVPVNLMAVYPPLATDPPGPTDFLPLALLLAAAGFLWWYGKRLRTILFILAAFVTLLFPVLGLIKLAYARSGTIFADHFLYLPGMVVIGGLGVALGWLWQKLGPRRQGTLSIGIALVVLGLGCQTWARATVYRNEESLWRDTLARNADAWQGHNRLGQLLFERRDFAAALPHYQRAVELRPNLAPNFNNVGLTYARLSRFPEAIAAYGRAVQISPEGARDTITFRLNLANALGSQAAQLQAQNSLDEAARLYHEAIREYKIALTAEPESPAAHRNLALILAQLGRREEAMVHLQETLRLVPNEPIARELLDELRRP